jgi:pimeloyl-ACP methyl ester carboxylesterase
MRRESVAIGHKSIQLPRGRKRDTGVRRLRSGTPCSCTRFPLQAAMWESTLAAVPEGWRAIAPDYRGFGRTPMPVGNSIGLSDLAGDVIDLLDRLEITQAAVVGCSMGGYVLFEILKSAPALSVRDRPRLDTARG